LTRPKIGIPLVGKDPDVVLDVQAVLEQAYEKGAYAERIDYRAPCRPALTKKEQAWADQRIRKARRSSVRRREPK
jgi:hypothetical protein